MKYMKLIGLAALAAMALMAFGAGTASATKLCKNNLSTTNCSEHYPEKTLVEATLTKNAKGEQTAILETLEGTVLDTCTGSTVAGKTENTAATGEPVKGKIETLTWSGCTKTTNTLSMGTLEISHIAGTDNGTLTGSSTEVTINTIFGSCVYGLAATGTHIGTVVGGNPATITISAIVPKLSGNFACPSESRWTATYTITQPNPLYVSHN